jgi:hypothetical protein
MRPCCRCRAAIENRVATCPHCAAPQGDGPRADAEPPPPRSRRWFARQLFTFLADLIGFAPALGILFLAVPLAVGGALGYLAASEKGAFVGAGAAVALFIVTAACAESGG